MALVFMFRNKCYLELHHSQSGKGFCKAGEHENKRLFSLFRLLCSGTCVFFVLFCTNTAVLAQYEPQFSQNMFNKTALNPAFAGSSGRVNLSAIDRSQLVGVEGAPRTTVVGGDMATNILGSRSAVGLTIMNDVAGFSNKLTINGLIARHYFLDEGILGIGLSVGIVNEVYDGTKLVFKPSDSSYHNDTDPAASNTKETDIAPDAGFGVSYIHPDFYAGISILHLFEPKQNFNEQIDVYIPRSFFFTAGYLHRMVENPIDLRPSVLVKKAGPLWQFDFNVNVYLREKYWAGLSYRLEDALAVMAGFEMNNGLKVGYCYDISTSGLSKVARGGAHEIMLGYTFDLSLEKRDKRYKSVRFL